MNSQLRTTTQTWVNIPKEFVATEEENARINDKSLSLSISSTLNLAIIKGEIHGKIHFEKFLELRNSMESHLQTCDTLNVYITIQAADPQGLLLLYSLAEIAGNATEKGKNFSIYWNTNGEDMVESFAKSFSQSFNCTFKTCNI